VSIKYGEIINIIKIITTMAPRYRLASHAPPTDIEPGDGH